MCAFYVWKRKAYAGLMYGITYTVAPSRGAKPGFHEKNILSLDIMIKMIVNGIEINVTCRNAGGAYCIKVIFSLTAFVP